MKFFITHHPPSGLKALEAAKALIVEYEKRNKWLESENLRLIGLAYPLTSSPKNEAPPMNTGNQELHDMRVLCSEQALQIRNKDLDILSLKSKVGSLEAKLDRTNPNSVHSQMGFVDRMRELGYNTERFEGAYASKMTQEFWECWQASRA